ncbi:hypothetical protein FEM48_Zijuj03G0176400 [Ziziphus jujuba var. spinosa]|uniref:Uncharacterized protein n=1 Tax=Ziziphus jujuba var. spinosa TaxID=714518 RepID=A0A978VRP9_ZIZJJ|nr:hypothetical protein FEM48_Zijuj03G0176400 [Ziziphus jujuba var. spinosa]
MMMMNVGIAGLDDVCKPIRCKDNGPTIRFPFRLKPWLPSCRNCFQHRIRFLPLISCKKMYDTPPLPFELSHGMNKVYLKWSKPMCAKCAAEGWECRLADTSANNCRESGSPSTHCVFIPSNQKKGVCNPISLIISFHLIGDLKEFEPFIHSSFYHPGFKVDENLEMPSNPYASADSMNKGNYIMARRPLQSALDIISESD